MISLNPLHSVDCCDVDFLVNSTVADYSVVCNGSVDSSDCLFSIVFIGDSESRHEFPELLDSMSENGGGSI